MLKKCLLSLFCFISVMWVSGEAPRERPVPDKGKIRVACIGDSITYGAGAAKEEESYPAQLQKLLGGKYQVVNFGDSGRGVILSSMRGNEPRAFYKRPAHQDALKFRPDIVICNLGINDDAVWSGNGKNRFVSDYLTLLSDYQKLAKPPKIFIWTKLAPLMQGHRSYDSGSTDIAFRMRTDLAEVAEKGNVIGIDAFSPLRGADNVFQRDGIHPNAKGLKLLAESTFRQIKPWLDVNARTLDLPWFFADEMVVQREAPVPVWGIAAPNCEVSVRFEGQPDEKAVTDLFGRFSLTLPALPVGGPYTLTVKTPGQRKTFKSVMSGDLWVCSGQSNLEFKVKQADGAKTALEDLQKKDRSGVRMLFRERALTTLGGKWPVNKTPPPENINALLTGTWHQANSRTVPEFSAISYYFARDLHEALKIPVGVICIAVGGTTTEALISEKGLLSDPVTVKTFSNKIWTDNSNIPAWTRLRGTQNLAAWFDSKDKAGMPPHPFEPAVLAEAGIVPLSRLPVKGFFFYQGESNATEGTSPDKTIEEAQNSSRLSLLIRDMRRIFRQPELPFYMIQLPSMNRPWENYRALQERVCRKNQAGICNILDLGNANDVHPREKAEVGKRLVNQVLHDVYGQKEIIAEGPFLKSIQKKKDGVEVSFVSTGEGIATKDKQSPSAFEVAEADGVFKPVPAEIVGKDRVLLKTKGVKVRFVRYAWAPVPKINLVNSAGLPAFPFKSELK